MKRPKPTTHELNIASSNGGKLPDSYKKRVKEYEEWLAKKEDSDDDAKDVEPSDDPKADNVFAELPDDTEFPYHYGGGNYYLSDGTKVSGKQEAVQAQQEIDEG